MARVKRGSKRAQRRKKILGQAKGYWGTKSKLHRAAKEQVMRSHAYAYRDRRQRKRDFRRLWIIRINAAARQFDLTYGEMISGLKLAGIEINRKLLADIAAQDMIAFGQLAEAARKAR